MPLSKLKNSNVSMKALEILQKTTQTPNTEQINLLAMVEKNPEAAAIMIEANKQAADKEKLIMEAYIAAIAEKSEQLEKDVMELKRYVWMLAGGLILASAVAPILIKLLFK